MMGKTHAVIGGATWLGTVLLVPSLAAYGVLAVLGGWGFAYTAALGPDIDHPNATATKLLGPVTKGINKLLMAMGVKHRGMTHSFLATVLVALTVSACIVYWHLAPWIAVSITVGWLSHSLIDAIGKKKVQFMWPAKGGLCLNLVSAGSWQENWIVMPLFILANIAFAGMLIFGVG